MKNIFTKSDHSFAWLNTTQFLGALNDNIFKLLVILFLIGMRESEYAANITAKANAVFVTPFLLLLAFAGRLADRRSKRDVIVACKTAELVVMICAVAAFMTGSVAFIYIVLFFMSVQSAFFSPCKYGIIRELVADEKVSKANGWVQGATFTAIIIGTVSAPLLLGVVWGNYSLAAIVCIVFAFAGIITSTQIRRTEPAGGRNNASLFFVKDIWRSIWSIHRKKTLFWAVIGSSYFWLIAAVIYLGIIPFGMEHLSLTKSASIYLYILAAFGIALGSLLAGKIFNSGFIPLGAIGMALCSLGLGLIGPTLLVACILIFAMGFCAGLFIVPVHTLIQLKSPKYRRSEIIAASSFLGWCSMLAASGVILLFSDVFGMSMQSVLLMTGIAILFVSVVIVFYMAESILWLMNKAAVRLIYRVKVRGDENVPADGGALIICNHVSYADAPLLAASCPRRLRFLIDRNYRSIFFLKPFCSLTRTIPIYSGDPPKKIAKSIRQARAAIEAGEVVCIFAEGAMTRNGNMLKFRSGFEKVVEGTKAPVIPAYIGGMWGSILTYYHGRPFASLSGKFDDPVSIHFGEPLPDNVRPEQVRLKVQELSCERFELLKSPRRTLAYRFIKTARKNRRHRRIADTTGRKLNYNKTLLASLALSRKIKEYSGDSEKIGLLLPSSVGATISNIAVTLLGKVPVNLNYTLSLQQIASAIEECEISCVISSSKFFERFEELKGLPGLVMLEDIYKAITPVDKFKAFLRGRFVPARILADINHRSCDDLAAVIFSSGSGGRPKGVMLSHHNIISNIDSMCSIFKIESRDNLCAVLPFFHSFGFTCSLWLPIINGVSSVFVPNPVDGKLTGRSAREHRSTVLFAAPTFLKSYIKRARPQDFAKLRYVVTGAEELKKTIAEAFERKFGIRPREGYGATELSPVVSFNLKDAKLGGFHQTADKDGTVGHPIPGVVVKVINPENKEILETNQDGLLMIKGPNVMLSYLNDEKKTHRAIQDGWYSTGDIGSIDDDGFIKITGRLARFSKIAGEMVPHVVIEDAYHNAMNADERLVAVTSVPNERKGEELIVLHLKQCDADKLHRIISDSDLPNLFKPKRENYFAIDEMPTLGSGKLDLAKLKQTAERLKR